MWLSHERQTCPYGLAGCLAVGEVFLVPGDEARDPVIDAGRGSNTGQAFQGVAIGVGFGDVTGLGGEETQFGAAAEALLQGGEEVEQWHGGVVADVQNAARCGGVGRVRVRYIGRAPRLGGRASM